MVVKTSEMIPWGSAALPKGSYRAALMMSIVVKGMGYTSMGGSGLDDQLVRGFR